MPFALRHRRDPMPPLPPLPGLRVRREDDPSRMAGLQGRGTEEMRRRFDAGHRAYVALVDAEPAGWGWVATRCAEVGEIGSRFDLPAGERYLWNFVTLPAHRGKGVYPHLLQTILRAEAAHEERFWVGYAPENHASGAGIRKAGFTTMAEVAFDEGGRPAVRAIAPDGAGEVARLLGLPRAERLSACWRCARARRSGAPHCAPGRCTCDYQRPGSGCAA